MIDTLEDDSTSGSPRAAMDQPGPQNLIVVDWAGASVQGTQRLRNEDSWGQLGPVFVLADGMGGLADGHLASSVACRSFLGEWMRAENASPVDAARQANQAVWAKREGDVSGSTLSALRIAHDQATVVHVGDSRVYRIRLGRAELLTRDHNVRGELLAAGIMPRQSQDFGPLRALTSYLGMPEHKLQIDVRSVGLVAGDRLVLCTDGVFDGLSHAELASYAIGNDAGLAAQALTNRSSRDDATALVIDIDVDGARGERI